MMWLYKWFKSGRLYVVVSQLDGITIKHVYLEKDRLRLVPDNKHFGEPYYLPLDDVLEIWLVKLRVTKSLSSHWVANQ